MVQVCTNSVSFLFHFCSKKRALRSLCDELWGVPAGVPLRRDRLYPLSYWGTSGRGVRSCDPLGGSSVPAVGGPSEVEGVARLF